jgi:hypothetical protein
MDFPLEWYTEQDLEVPGPSFAVAEHGDWDEDDWELLRTK